MAEKSLGELAKKMRDIDFAMLFTKSDTGELAGRPMSNNGEVEYQGDSYFFSYSDTRKVRDIERDAKVALSYQGAGGLLGKPPIFVSVEGEATLIRDRAAFEERWTNDLDRWFPQGTETPGIVLIKVSAERVHFWDGEDEGEIALK
jgi:general stress protein 26